MFPVWQGAQRSRLPGVPGGCRAQGAPCPAPAAGPGAAGPGAAGLLAGLGAIFHILNSAEPIWYKFMLIPPPPPLPGLFREPEKTPL